MRKKDHAMVRVTMYFYDNRANKEDKIRNKLDIVMTNVQLNTNLGEAYFSEKKYIAKKKNRYVATTAYSSYRFLNGLE